MQALTPTPTPNASEEVLIERKITFRNSTFGALKVFIRGHQRRTGQHLSNAAAVDIFLRAYLAAHIHPDAVAEMTRLSRPDAVRHLTRLPKEVENSCSGPDAAPGVTSGTPRTTISVDMPRSRPLLAKQTPEGAA